MIEIGIGQYEEINGFGKKSKPIECFTNSFN